MRYPETCLHTIGRLCTLFGIESLQPWLRAALEAELSGLSAHGEVHLSGFLFEAQASPHRTVRAFQDRLAKEIERALGLSFAGAQFEAQIQEPARRMSG